MSMNWTWPKATALAVVQSVAHTLLGLVVGHEFLEIAWVKSFEAAGMTGLVTFLTAVVAYGAKDGTITRLINAPVAAAADAAEAQAVVESLPEIPPHDVQGARGW